MISFREMTLNEIGNITFFSRLTIYNDFKIKETKAMTKLPKIALGAWAWGNDGTFGNSLTAESLRPIFDTAMADSLKLNVIRFWEKEMK